MLRRLRRSNKNTGKCLFQSILAAEVDQQVFYLKKPIKSCISNYAGLPKELLLISYVAFTQDYNLHT